MAPAGGRDRVAAALAAAGPLSVGQLLRVAGDVGLVRRALAGIGGPVAERHGDVGAEQLAAPRPLAERHGLRAAAGLEAHVHAVAVEVLALARERRRGPSRTPCSSRRRSRTRRWITMSPVGRSTSARAARGERRLRAAARATRRSAARGRAWRARAPWPGRRSSASRDEPARLRDPRERRLDRGRRLADARQDLARERARGRERGVERGERAVGVLERRRELADRGAAGCPTPTRTPPSCG